MWFVGFERGRMEEGIIEFLEPSDTLPKSDEDLGIVINSVIFKCR